MGSGMYIGIDLGTSEVKAVLMGSQGDIVASSGVPLSISRSHAQWSEQNPDDWWQATLQALMGLKTQAPDDYAQTQAIGLSGQMHGAVLLGEQGDVLRPAILWNDARAYQECVELEQLVHSLHQITGNLAMPGFTAPKLLWVHKHEPEVFKRIAKVLLPKDYLRFKLTGQYVSDMSDASGTLWLDVAHRSWSDEVLSACGLTRQHMPSLVEGSEATGELRAAVADQTRLPQAVIVAGGGGDNAVSAVGMGAVSDGDGFISLGTSGVLFVVNHAYRPNPESAVHTFCHAIPHTWHQMSVMLSAASALRWLCQMVGVSEKELLAEVSALSLTDLASAPIFLPYLSGERTPHNDPHAKGVFYGLTLNHQRAHMAYAVIEGVAFGMRDGLLALADSGTQVRELSLVGGGAKSDLWAQLLADVLNVTIHKRAGGDVGGAVGAARLGALASEQPMAQVCVKPAVVASFSPQAHQTYLTQRYEQYVQLYRDLKVSFRKFAVS